jgi:hypothetical protein
MRGPYLRAICRLRWGNQQRGRADADLCDTLDEEQQRRQPVLSRRLA